MKLVITGATGLIGWHAAARAYAMNCAAKFRGHSPPFNLVLLDRSAFEDDARLRLAVTGADAVLHFAGANRGTDDAVENANPAIAQRLVEACRVVGAIPSIVYANSIHAASSTPYGRSKRQAGVILSQLGGRYINLVLPHIFGEGARPRYNNVTATFIEAVIKGEMPSINPAGRVFLLHAGVAAQTAIDAAVQDRSGDICPVARDISVAELFAMLKEFHASYQVNVFPDLRSDFLLAVFNSYRSALYPKGFPRPLKINADPRGTLFEAVKGGGGGQVFFSKTELGATRGNHFHLSKVERFLVVHGEAIIRIRKVLSGEVWEYRVSGKTPAPVDIPTLHTHSIENVGDTPLMTLFWTHDLFDPKNPDTYADKVLQ